MFRGGVKKIPYERSGNVILKNIMPGAFFLIYWAFSRHLRQKGGLQGVRLLVNPMKTTILPQMPRKSTVYEDEWARHYIFSKLHYLSFQMTYQPCSNSFWIVFCDHFSNHKKFWILKANQKFQIFEILFFTTTIWYFPNFFNFERR